MEEEADITTRELLERIIKIERKLKFIFNPKINAHRKRCLVYCKTQMALPNVDTPPLEDDEIIEIFGVNDGTKEPVRFIGKVKEYKRGEKRLKFKNNDLINKGDKIIVNNVIRKGEEPHETLEDPVTETHQSKNEAQMEKNDTINEKEVEVKIEVDKDGFIKSEEKIDDVWE